MAGKLLDSMAEAAQRFLDGLDDIQRGRATRPFSDERERTEWYYTPNARPGIPLIELDAVQQQMARRLLYTGLSEGGYNTAATIMGIEAILDPVEHWRAAPYPGYDQAAPSIWRSPSMYFVCVFGSPGSERWGWSFGGHHVSVHYTVVGDGVSANPCFFGAHPAEPPLQPGFFLRPLEPERKLGLELLHSLDAGQRAKATLLAKAPHDLVTTNRPAVREGALPLPTWVIMGPRAVPESAIPATRKNWERQFAHLPLTDEELAPVAYTAVPKGLAAAEMTAGQQDALRELLRVYTSRLPEEASASQVARIAEHFGELHFAWAGGDAPHSAHYYRIQGPRLLVEYDSPFEDGCHIHAVMRDPEGDFGVDLLARHYAEAHR
ncbi:MAG: DUF3500 domain-containing protein [Dehalococcoidia bacterium]